MKKFLLCVMLIALSVSVAWGGPVRDFINKVVDETLNQSEPEQGKTLITSERIRALINSGDDINAKGDHDTTILMLASAFSNSSEMVNDLIKAGAYVNAKNMFGWQDKRIKIYGVLL